MAYGNALLLRLRAFFAEKYGEMPPKLINADDAIMVSFTIEYVMHSASSDVVGKA